MPINDLWVRVNDTVTTQNEVTLTNEQWEAAKQFFGKFELFSYSYSSSYPEEEVSEGDKEWGVVSVHKNRRQKCERE